MDNTISKIRKISVGLDLNNQMSYTIGSKRAFFLEDGSKAIREIHNILEKEDYYLIYILGDDNEIQPWKKLPKNNLTAVEYVID